MSETEKRLRERVDELREQLRQLQAVAFPTDWEPPLEWRLPRSQVAILRALVQRERASREYLFEATRFANGPTRKDEVSIKIVDVQISKLRKNLPPPFTIHVAYGHGYYLKPEHREALKALV